MQHNAAVDKAIGAGSHSEAQHTVPFKSDRGVSPRAESIGVQVTRVSIQMVHEAAM
jgi:hypothetical protein